MFWVLTVDAEIRARRAAKGWTQEEAATALDMDRSRLSAIERDDTTLRVTVAECNRFLRVLGLPLEAWGGR